jgi:hypothetical protein
MHWKIGNWCGRATRMQADDGEGLLFVKSFYYDWRINNIVVILSLTDKKGNPSTGRLTIRITQQSTSVVAGTAVEQALLSGTNHPQPPAINTMSNAVTDLTDTASNQQKLVTSFGSLLDKVGILVTVGDEVAKVCPLPYSSWSHRPKIFEDTSLCQFCVASTLCRTQGTSNSFTPVFCAHRYCFLNRWSERNKIEIRRF